MPSLWQGVFGASLALVVIASFAERRRLKRNDLDRVGFMPWNLVLVMAGIVALVAALLEYRLG